MTEGMLVEWLVKPGAAVRAGEILYIVETDKIANEIVADRDGVVESIIVHVDETVPVGATLGIWAGGPKIAISDIPKPDPAVAAGAENDAAHKVSAPLDAPASATGRIVATPHARKLAREHCVELEKLSGSGLKGRIVAQDVRLALESSEAISVSEDPIPSAGTPLRGIQKVIAAQMLRSSQEIPHFHLTASAEISELLWLHDGLKQKPEIDRITLTHWIATAVGLVIADTPQFRMVLVDDRLHVLPGSSVGIAVAITDGIHVPVARDLGARGLAENALQIERLIDQARNSALTADSMYGAATTVTNLGSFAIDQVFPLIMPGQSSIVGVGRQQSIFRPDDDGEPALRRELGLVLGCDHRVLNGADGAAMLEAIVKLLEDPLLIIAQARK